jgi:hypothetical protein
VLASAAAADGAPVGGAGAASVVAGRRRDPHENSVSIANATHWTVIVGVRRIFMGIMGAYRSMVVGNERLMNRPRA